MTATSLQPQGTAALPAPDGLVLRLSPALATVPPPRAPVSATIGARPPAASDPPAEGAAGEEFAGSGTWLLIALAALASTGWLLERLRRRQLETEKDSVMWADVQPPGSSIITHAGEVEETVPAVREAAEPGAPTELVTRGGSTSRREATLIDLHQLEGKLRRRRASGDLSAALLLLLQHLEDFRYTSPWVFLELRELHHLLGREQEWGLAREAFRGRFAQRAPVWQAPSTAHVQLADDAAICADLVPHWPYREARMVIRQWILGERDGPDQPHRPPVLALGVYRDLLFLDRLLDRVMLTRAAPEDSLL